MHQVYELSISQSGYVTVFMTSVQFDQQVTFGQFVDGIRHRV